MVILYEDFKDEEIRLVLKRYDLGEIDAAEFESRCRQRLEKWLINCHDKKKSEDERQAVFQKLNNDNQRAREALKIDTFARLEELQESMKHLPSLPEIADQLKRISDRLDRLELSDLENFGGSPPA